MRKLIIILLLACLSLGLAGCGETFSGVGKDIHRMGKGTSTFFFRQP